MTSLVRVIGGGSGDGAFDALFKWVLFIALMCLSAVVLYDYGLLTYMFVADQSRISVVIAALFLGFCGHCLWILLEMSGEYRQALAVTDALAGLHSGADVAAALAGKVAPTGLIAGYLRDLLPAMTHTGEGDRTLLLQSLAASLKKRNKIGTYGTDLLYKLGMLGTMVGFVMMLNSMGDMANFDVDTLRVALQKMIAGMAVSLLTTIAGLIGGILLRVQYNLSEALATDIVQTTIQFTEVSLVPLLSKGLRDV